MFNIIKMIFNLVPEPKVGDILVDKDWGGDYNKVEIVRVSENKMEVIYKFLKANGNNGTSDTYSGTWRFLCTDSYKLEEK